MDKCLVMDEDCLLPDFLNADNQIVPVALILYVELHAFLVGDGEPLVGRSLASGLIPSATLCLECLIAFVTHSDHSLLSVSRTLLFGILRRSSSVLILGGLFRRASTHIYDT
ncbi:hypothetical protein CA13_17340 [Planctomycetes bacterium CA13]|uniref:Uncharacterized protein n=1 Tax=Novipirellula herctigrandis TaxID=2527986 RepID=A0A5C5Z0I8_9BACT|nr:hypothetical protein CA13_17340 [Planctomycetes bacterium CA13]